MPLQYIINEKKLPADGKIKIAAFDYDHTLVKPLNGKRFPSNIDDWMWFNNRVFNKLVSLSKDNYLIAVFTNQSKEWKCVQIKNVLTTLNIPVFVNIATSKDEYKPNTMIFDTSFNDIKHRIDFEKSFYIGDALGRKGDFSDSDKVFGDNIGFEVLSPEIFFKREKDVSLPLIKIPESSIELEVVIMVGYPGAGKTTIAKSMEEKYDNYVVISGDVYKTSKAMIKVAKEYKDKKSVIFDATNSSRKKRSEYIEFAKKYNYKHVRCIHCKTSYEEAYERNLDRPVEKQVPRIAYSVFNKYYEEPSIEEGFDEIISI